MGLVLPLFPSAVLSLDPYPLVEQVTDTAAKLYPNAKNKAKSLIQRARKAIGMRDRRGRTKYRKGPNRRLYKKRKFHSNGTGQQILDDVLLPIVDDLIHCEQGREHRSTFARRAFGTPRRPTERIIGHGGWMSEYRKAVPLADVEMDKGAMNRVPTGLSQLDHPLGGGLVSGSVVLIGGNPGVGKSTLAITACSAFASEGRKVLYVTGEESLQQIRMRADRVGVARDSLMLLATTDWDHIESETRASGAYVLVIDSAQTCRVPGIDAIPGSVAQVREVAHRARQLATDTHVSIVLIGHSSRSTELAGPLVLEHFVDTVLDFEHDGRSSLRSLRTIKNRFGEAGQLGLFEMTATGLVEILDPSKRLLVSRQAKASGTAVVATVEGTRPILVEIQALVGRPTDEDPPRHFIGVDPVRTTMLAAILENSGLQVYNRGLYVNTGAGYRLREPGADVGITAAFASSLLKQAIREDTCVFGEVGLVGQIRPVRYPEKRFVEAFAQGFSRVVCSQEDLDIVSDIPEGLEVVGVSSVRDVLAEIF